MKKIKSILCICLIFMLLFSMTVPCFATQSDYDFLLNCGFSETFLNSLTDDMLARMCHAIGEDTVVSVKNSCDYIYKSNNTSSSRISIMLKEEIFKLEMEHAIICKKDTNIITGVLVGVGWEWFDSEPVVQKIDTVAINWDGSVFDYSPDTFYLQELYRFTHSPEDWVIGSEYTVPAEVTQGGLGFYTTLFADTPTHSVSNKGACLFLLDPKSTIYDNGENNTESISVNTNYVHNANVFVPKINLDVSGESVGIEEVLISEHASASEIIEYSK